MATFYESLSAAQKMYSMYFIAKYESSWSWDGHNLSSNVQYDDPFTIGIMQWAGTHAYEFLRVLSQSTYSAFYSALPQSWRDAVNAGSGSPMWGGHSMTQADVDTWRQAVANNLQEAKTYQEWYWVTSSEVESLKWELDILNSWGTLPANPTLNQIKVVYFYLARFHNCGNNMKRLFDQYGWNVSLATLRDATIAMYQTFTNFAVYGAGWTNAINDNFELLNGWDGSTVPQFGQVDGFGNDTGTGNDNTATPIVTTWETELINIQEFGDSLIAVMKGGKKIVLTRANAGNVWIPVNRVVGSGDNSSSTQSGTSTMTPTMQAVMNYYMSHENLYAYSLDPNEYDNPPVSGASNCSAYIRFVARTVAPGSEMASLPYSYTGAMAVAGTRVASGDQSSAFPYDLAKPGDVLLLNKISFNPEFDHVELFLGTEAQGNTSGSELWGAGSAPLPHKNGYASSLLPFWHDWELRRISWE